MELAAGDDPGLPRPGRERVRPGGPGPPAAVRPGAGTSRRGGGPGPAGASAPRPGRRPTRPRPLTRSRNWAKAAAGAARGESKQQATPQARRLLLQGRDQPRGPHPHRLPAGPLGIDGLALRLGPDQGRVPGPHGGPRPLRAVRALHAAGRRTGLFPCRLPGLRRREGPERPAGGTGRGRLDGDLTDSRGSGAPGHAAGGRQGTALAGGRGRGRHTHDRRLRGGLPPYRPLVRRASPLLPAHGHQRLRRRDARTAFPARRRTSWDGFIRTTARSWCSTFTSRRAVPRRLSPRTHPGWTPSTASLLFSMSSRFPPHLLARAAESGLSVGPEAPRSSPTAGGRAGHGRVLELGTRPASLR